MGPGALSHEELVALLLRTGGRERDATALATVLLRASGGLSSLAQASAVEMAAHPGLGIAKASSVVAAFELGRRAAARSLAPGTPIGGPEDVDGHFRARLRGVHREHFYSLLLDSRHRLIREVAVSTGTLNASLVHPREVFRTAVRESAATVVLVHNHPSGDPKPSREDRDITRRLARAGALLGIPVLDHVVVAERGFRSLRQDDEAPGGEYGVGGGIAFGDEV